MPSTQKAASSTPRRVDIPGTADTLNLNTMGGRITWARIRKELRQEDVAEKLGKSRATIVQYEKDNIMPPIPEVVRLADTLDVSPEFLAFGRQGVDALRNGRSNSVVTMTEMSVGGKRGLFNSGEVALPKSFFGGKDINLERTKMVVLDHDEDEFQYYKGDRLIVDQSATALTDTSRDTFLVQIGDGAPAVMRREGLTQTGKVRLMDGGGKTHLFAIDDVKVIGAVNGGLVLA
jgi:transcriptional regulator with XRE-family HTH domain